MFTGARFRGSVWFDEAAFRDDAESIVDFTDATFDSARTLGLCTSGRLVFDGATFGEALRLNVSGLRVSFDRTVFRAGVDLFVRGEVSLEDADFAAPSLLAPFREGGMPDSDSSEQRTRVVSLRRAKVAHLTVARLDMKACRFAGAHGLDGMRLDDLEFSLPPGEGARWTRTGWRWSGRQTIAEEHHWRQEHSRRGKGWYGAGWYGANTKAPSWLENATKAPSAAEIASIYRALRKAKEDAKNEPGAGSFYYGEMEMRRHRTSTRRGRERPVRAERRVLWLYWLVAGYGLRGGRALAALAITIAVAAVPLSIWGFRFGQPYHEYGRALLFALDSAVSLLRAPTVKLTAGGQLIEILLRLAGPLLFGLALVSVRGRVKR